MSTSELSRVLATLALAGGFFLSGAAIAQAPAAPAGQQTFDSVLSPNAKEQAQRQQSQPGNNQPVWKDVRSEKAFTTTDRGIEAGVLIQSGGETWRQRRNNQIIPLGGMLIAGIFGLCALFYLWKGTIKLQHPETGRKVQRFSSFERMAHWTTAISFSVLALSGLVMMFGKAVLLPVIGHTLFAWLTILCKNLHNFVGPLFAVSVLVLFFTFLKHNWPRIHDLTWFAKGGGLTSGEHVPSGMFNAGEKVWFWAGVLLLGVTVSVSGLVLNFPNFQQGRGVMQLANIVHMVSTVLMMAMALGHIYMGTIGVQGAFDAMKTGYVDEAWAKEHHEYWFNEVKAGQGAAGGGQVALAAPRKEEPQ